MKIAVTDACIFIDLIELKIISDFFKLNIELHTTVDVVNELYPEQKEILIAYSSVNQLVIHNLKSEQIKEMESMTFPRGLSPEDKTVLYMATHIKEASVLSSDKLVRDYAGKLSIEYHGIFWIFDQLVKEKVLPKDIGVAKLIELLQMNAMYSSSKMRKEADKRIERWR